MANYNTHVPTTPEQVSDWLNMPKSNFIPATDVHPAQPLPASLLGGVAPPVTQAKKVALFNRAAVNAGPLQALYSIRRGVVRS